MHGKWAAGFTAAGKHVNSELVRYVTTDGGSEREKWDFFSSMTSAMRSSVCNLISINHEFCPKWNTIHYAFKLSTYCNLVVYELKKSSIVPNGTLKT